MHDAIARLARLSPYWLAAAIAGVTALALLALGRLPICSCGSIKLWHGLANSSETSQHISDWYTFSHIIHGFIFYGLLWWLAPSWSIGQRFAVAVALEAGWEILENSPLIIDRYRTATIALDYYGDSVLNSLSDIASMALGFWVASVLPVAATIAIAVLFEVGTAYVIRDNLALNVLMLVHPLEAVKAWQAGGAP